MKSVFLPLMLFGVGFLAFILSCSINRKNPTKIIAPDLPQGIITYKEYSNGYHRIAIQKNHWIRETTAVAPKFYRNCIIGDTIVNK